MTKRCGSFEIVNNKTFTDHTDHTYNTDNETTQVDGNNSTTTIIHTMYMKNVQMKHLQTKWKKLTIQTCSTYSTEDMTKADELIVDKYMTLQNQATQTTKTETHRFLDILLSGKNFKAFTGVEFDVFQKIEQCILLALDKSSIIKKKESVMHSIIVVLIKIRHNFSFRIISTFMEKSETIVRKYFHEFVHFMAIVLKPIIVWPTREANLRNLPKCFIDFKNTKIVLDCTEVLVQTPSCLKCRIHCYSHYKSAHTIKFMIGVTPFGTIAYLSDAYGGRSSDKAIFNIENIISRLEPQIDAIMVDKGFRIEKECKEHGIELIRPPFIKNGKPLSKEEAEYSTQIARARVHVERVIQRLKLNAILQHKIEWSMLPYIDDAACVAEALINLQPPILANDEIYQAN